MVRPAVSRRKVLGAAAGAAAAAAAARLVGLGGEQAHQLQRLLARDETSPGGWNSPLGSEKARVAHLLRRTTFGASAAELERALSDGYDRTVDRLLETPAASPPDFAGLGRPGQPVRLNIGQLQLWWVNHMLQTRTPFAERMTLFWHGHFTSDYRKVGLRTPFLYWQNLTWRAMALTDMRSMLMRVTTDPAMLRYLDLASSTGQNPNENYARELMELFALGVGHYSEDDVRAAAKALAGWVEPRADAVADVTVDAKNGVTRKYPVYGTQASAQFVPHRAYHGGQLDFLGRRGSFETLEVIDQILAQPASAVFIARKVAQHFVSASLEESYVRRLGDSFRASRYDVKALMHAVLSSPEFTAHQTYRGLVKAPVEMMVHALKALNAPGLGRLVVQSGAGLGQALFDPPDVAGWPSNQAWISSNSVVARVNFVSSALRRASTLPPGREAVTHLDGVLGSQMSRLLGRAADDRARWFMALASPEFQLK
jgi:uncharacterized protein (DUF1800 family)